MREGVLVEQIKELLQTISLCDEYIDYMLSKVEKWETEAQNSSQSCVQNLSNNIKVSEALLEKLVESYLDGDVPKDIYNKKKDEIMRATLTFKQEKKEGKQLGRTPA